MGLCCNEYAIASGRIIYWHSRWVISGAYICPRDDNHICSKNGCNDRRVLGNDGFYDTYADRVFPFNSDPHYFEHLNMENSSYIAINRQSGLINELDVLAQNIANISSHGYKREGLVFSEYVVGTGQSSDSLSMAHAAGRIIDSTQGALEQTNGAFDFAIEGDGFFLVSSQDGNQLTRAGSFTPSTGGVLVAPDGAELLDAGGGTVVLPIGVNEISLGADGTLSANGEPIAQIGLWAPADPEDMTRAAGVRFNPQGEVVPVVGGRILQGFLETSNVNPVSELSRMISVQRAYELGASFLDKEDERVRATIRVLGQ